MATAQVKNIAKFVESIEQDARRAERQATFRLVLDYLADVSKATASNYEKSGEGPDGYYGGRRDAVDSLYARIFQMSQNRETK